MITIIWVIFAIMAVWIGVVLVRDVVKHREELENNSWVKTGLIGFIGNFFDVLGIGSFALETTMFKFSKQSTDRLIPGTLNVANAIPTVAQALIFIQIVEVEPITLVLMLASAGAG